MTNKVINIDSIRELEDHTIRDGDTIRAIALYHQSNPGDKAILDKIDPMCNYLGLYPHVFTMDYSPIIGNEPTEITEIGRKYLNDFNELMKKYK